MGALSAVVLWWTLSKAPNLCVTVVEVFTEPTKIVYIKCNKKKAKRKNETKKETAKKW